MECQVTFLCLISNGLTQHWTNKHVKLLKNYLLNSRTYSQSTDSTNGINNNFKIKLTPIDESPGHSQNLPTPINLIEDITALLPLWQKCGIITTLPFSKLASPLFAQIKPNGKLRLFVDLRKINNLAQDDYINNNHVVSTLTGAAQRMPGKKILQTRLFPSLSLFTNGKPTTCENAWI